MAMQALIGDYDAFLRSVVAGIEGAGIPLQAPHAAGPHMEIDHICYRCASLAEYVDLKARLAEEAGCSLLIESMIGNRPISILEFPDPIQHAKWSVRCLELASPKPGRQHRRGLEHAEVVIGSEPAHMLSSKALLESFMAAHDQVQFDTGGIEKAINADVSVSVPGGLTVKFHACPIYEVVEYEKKNGLVEAVPPEYFMTN
jgi:predicted metalloenzyme YecM